MAATVFGTCPLSIAFSPPQLQGTGALQDAPRSRWPSPRAPACLGLRGQAPRDPAFARTEIFRITNVSRPPESTVAAPALSAHSKFVQPKLPLAAATGPGARIVPIRSTSPDIPTLKSSQPSPVIP